MNNLYSAIYFDNNVYPTSTGQVKESDPHDWVDSTVKAVGYQTVSLFCRAMPYRKKEDFHDYFHRNEVVWYKFFLSRDAHIIKILKIHTYDLLSSVITNFDTFLPMYEYQMRAMVSDVNQTDDAQYKTFTDFWIKYNTTYIDKGAS